MDKSSYPQYGDKIGEKPVDNCGQLGGKVKNPVYSTKNAVDKNGEKRRNIVGKPVKTFCARVKTGWVNIKVESVIKFITA